MRQLLAFCLVFQLQANLIFQTRSAESDASSQESMPSVVGLPDYQEIFDTIESRLNDISREDLEHAALQGILTEFQSRIELEAPIQAEVRQPSRPSLAKKEFIGNHLIYLRVADIHASTAEEASEAVEGLRVQADPEGLVLDLRYTGGSDYASAMRFAGLFLEESTPFLDWGQGVQKIPAGSNRIQLPMVVLVNEATTGAAEALAGALQQAKAGPLVGRQTIGNAQPRQRITLSSGHFLLVAAGSITLADGQPLTGNGVRPDILVDVSAPEQAALFDDPFGEINQPTTESGERMNEAELMRRQKENGGAAVEINIPPVTEEAEASTAPKAIQDPILARGVDVLTGWSIFRKLQK